MNKDFYKLGIIGYPLSHSISPLIQEEALKSVNLNGTYQKFEITADKLAEQIEFFIDNDFSGFNVTIPHKINIRQFLNEIDEPAKKIGAINTVKINSDKTLKGFNTDIFGFINAIPKNIQPALKNAKILGCGGAALAVVFGLEQIGIQNITICARNLEKAKNFIENIQNKTSINFQIENIEKISTLENTDILINSTPLGTKGSNENLCPIKKELFSNAKPNLFVYDLVYNPQETLLIKNAKEFNLPTINGLDMLILQGAKAFEIWTNKTPSICQMKTIALKNL